MPDAPAYPIQGGKLFDMDDDEDLYGEQPDKNGKTATRGHDPSKCVLQ